MPLLDAHFIEQARLRIEAMRTRPLPPLKPSHRRNPPSLNPRRTMGPKPRPKASAKPKKTAKPRKPLRTQ